MRFAHGTLFERSFRQWLIFLLGLHRLPTASSCAFWPGVVFLYHHTLGCATVREGPRAPVRADVQSTQPSSKAMMDPHS